MNMKKYICLLAGVALFAACEKTTVTNPPAENKTETNTTIVKDASPAPDTKTETTTTTTTTSPAPTP
jgi:hypothetical protein